MGRWDSIATDLLNAAVGSGVPVARSFVAPGPTFAHPCRLIAVHLAGTREVALGDTTSWGPMASVTRARYVVTFVADCMPTIDAEGNPPPEADITAAGLAVLADANAIHDALLDPVFTTDGIGCQNVTVEDGEPFGPSGGKAGWRWPVSVVLT